MEQLYRLKKEARQFFGEQEKGAAKPLDWWQGQCISRVLLDEVEMVYVQYGQVVDALRTSLCGHEGPKQKAHFHFTVYIEGMSDKEYDKVDVIAVMDEVQKVLNRFFK
jgi:hypothetical protein